MHDIFFRHEDNNSFGDNVITIIIFHPNTMVIGSSSPICHGYRIIHPWWKAPQNHSFFHFHDHPHHPHDYHNDRDYHNDHNHDDDCGDHHLNCHLDGRIERGHSSPPVSPQTL